MRLALAVPLAALAAIVTLFSSSYLLNFSGSQHFKVITGDFFDDQPSLREYHSAGEAQLPLATTAEPAGALTAPVSATPEITAPVTAASVAATPITSAVEPVDKLSNSRTPRLRRFSAEDFAGNYLVAREESPEIMEKLGAGRDPTYPRRLLKSLLGMAFLLKRTLVLPAYLCRCRDANLTDCDGPSIEPFDCPLKEALKPELWQEQSLVKILPARFLKGDLPDEIKRSHVRLLLPDGMDDGELQYALRYYSTTRWLEVQEAANSFCGWDIRMPGNPKRMSDFEAASNALLASSATGAAPTVPLHMCTHYRGGTGEVLTFVNVGQADERHEVSASRERLPDSIRDLPKDTDLMVTFATGSVATMACNWVKNVERAGVTTILLGALDQKMMDACETEKIPCILIEGGAVTKALSNRRAENVRADPALYPKMSVLKVGSRKCMVYGRVHACTSVCCDPLRRLTTCACVGGEVSSIGCGC